MMSDTSDIRGPISLTRAGLQVKSVLSSTFVLCNLSPANVWHTPCARPKVLLVFGVSRPPGIKLTGHEKSNERCISLHSDLAQHSGVLGTEIVRQSHL